MSEATTSATGMPENSNVTEQLTDEKGKANLQAGETALTFDELDELTLKKASKKDDKPEKSKDLTSDDKKGKTPKTEDEPKNEDKKDEKKAEKADEDQKKADKAEKELRKTIKAKLKDAELDIDEEAMVPVKVNGETQYWTMKELLAQQSGKVAYDKKFTELDQMRKSTEGLSKKLQSANEMIRSAFEEQDPFLKMYKMSQIAGVDPVQFREQFFNDNIKLLEKYYTMTDDERKADAKEYEARIHKHRADTLEQTIKAQQSQRELAAKIDQVRASHQISEQEFFDKFEYFNQQVNEGKMKPEVLSPEYIAETVLVDRIWTPAAEKLDSLKLGLNPEQREKVLIDVVTSAMKLGIKPDDVPEIIDEVYGTGKARRKVTEKKKEAEEFVSGRKEVPNTNAKASQPLFFDEIL